MLYNKFKLSDGHQLFWEVHQAGAMSPVDVVVPNCEEAERMVIMMNKNISAFVMHYLRDYGGVIEEVAKRLVRATTDPEKCSQIAECEWDKEKCILTTKEDKEAEDMQEMEAAAWYIDELGEHMEGDKKGKKKWAAKEELEDMNCDQSFKSVHNKKGSYSGSPGVTSVSLGKEDGDAMEEDDEKAMEGRDLSKMSKEELIELFKQHKISPGKTGSPPTGSPAAGAGDNSSAGDGESDSSSDGSDSDSDSEVVEVTPPPKQGGSTTVRKPASGE